MIKEVKEKAVINTERLTLVPHGTKYLDTTHEYAADMENTKYMMALPSDSLEATREFLESCEKEWEKEKPEFYELAILKDGIQIGSIGLYLNESYDTCELGWILARDYQGFGYATEAAMAAMKYAKEEIGIHHFIAHCDSENSASENVMKKLGMTKVSCHGGRKNKGSNEERMEYLYERFYDNEIDFINNNESKNKVQYMPIFMCLGLSIGMAIGVNFDNIAVGMCLGMSAGMGIGTLIDLLNNSKDKKDVSQNDGEEKDALKDSEE